METLNKIFGKALPVIQWISRHFVVIAIGIVCLWVLAFERAVISNILLISIYEALALTLSSIALYAYTKINFTRQLSTGKDDVMSQTEQYSFQHVIASIFVGVHILVGLVSLSLYLSYDKVQGDAAKIEANKIEIDTIAIKKSIIEPMLQAKYEAKLLDSLKIKDTVK